MIILNWFLGLAIATWVGASGITAMLKTKTATIWFGEYLKQSSGVMIMNGVGLTIAALIVLLNLIFPEQVTKTSLKWALVGIFIAQLSTFFMLVRGNAPSTALVAPIGLGILCIAYWFVRI